VTSATGKGQASFALDSRGVLPLDQLQSLSAGAPISVCLLRAIRLRAFGIRRQGVQEVFILARETRGPHVTQTETRFLCGRFQVHPVSRRGKRVARSESVRSGLSGCQFCKAQFLANNVENPGVGSESRETCAAVVCRSRQTDLFCRNAVNPKESQVCNGARRPWVAFFGKRKGKHPFH